MVRRATGTYEAESRGAVSEEHTPVIELRNFDMKRVRVMYYRSEATGEWTLKVHSESPDRDTGEPNMFVAECSFTRDPTPQELAYNTVKEIMRHIEHEVCEALHIDGVRVLDPHRTEAP